MVRRKWLILPLMKGLPLDFSLSDTLFVSDMDGTLLGDDSRVSAVSARILNRLTQERGLLFTVATARTPATVVPLMEAVHTRLPYVVMSGAALWDANSGEFADVQVIEADVVSAACDILEHHGLHPFVYRRHGKMLHAHHWGDLSASEQEFVSQRDHLPLKRFVLDDRHYATHPTDPALLIFSMCHYETLEGVYREVSSSLSCTAVFYRDIFDPATGLLEIYRKGTSKAAAIARLARRAGASRVVAFGDNLNDLPMLQAADYAVAVDNAVDKVKCLAHEIIEPNTEHSVARWIESVYQQSPQD